MNKIFPALRGTGQHQAAALCFGLFFAAATAHGQAAAVYGLGIATANYTTALGTVPVGTEFLTSISPGSPALTPSSTLIPISGIGPNQQLVGLDVRPNTGQLYALGYNNTAGASPNAQLYSISISGSAATATPVGSSITLNLGTSARTDLNGYNLVIGVGFDFDPRADRIRVTGQNGMNYRLNPVTGQLVTDSPLVYATSGNAVTPPTTPDIGAVAYTGSALGLTGTALYDVDQTPNNGILATQSIVANANTTNGTLTAISKLTLTSTKGSYGIGDSNFDVDIYTDPSIKQNTAYLLELTGPTAGSVGSSNLYTLNLANGNATLLGNIIGGTPIRIINIAAAPASAPSIWTGKVDTNWGTAGNWSTNMVPTASIDVFIPGSDPVNVLRQPTVSDAQQARSLVLSTGSTGNSAVLTLATGGTLSVSGNFANNDGSIASSSTGTLALVGSTVQDISGPSLTQFPNLTVGPGAASLSGPAAVQGGLTLTGSLAIGNGQAFTLLSNASGTAYVVNNGGTATGTATVQRYITPTNTGPGYRHYAAPVSGTTVNDLATGSFTPIFNTDYNTSATPGATAPFPNVFGYSQAQYEGSLATTITTDFDKGFYSPAAGTAWMPGTGYTVNLGGKELADFMGTLTAGNVSTAGQGRSTKANAGWQLLGNPYPSALDWNQVVASGLVNIRPTLYVFKSTGQYSGNYASYLNGQITNGGTNVVPVAQGFFVQTSAVGATGSINFTDAQRIATASTAPFQRTAADTRPQLLLELGNGTVASQTDIYFEQGATAGLDNAFDATALPFLNGLTLASEAGNAILAINGLPALSAAVTVPLQVAVATAGTYSLQAANLANLPAGYHAYLRDAVLNTYTDLATTPSISLNLPGGAATGRFAVVFTNASPLASAPAALAALASVYPSPASGKATLMLPQALRGNATSTVQLLNALGQAVLTRTIAPGSADATELPLTGLAAGIYTVRASTVAGQVAKRLVIE
jgi:hypothetical protein